VIFEIPSGNNLDKKRGKEKEQCVRIIKTNSGSKMRFRLRTVMMVVMVVVVK
jgi:hypothetical protein